MARPGVTRIEVNYRELTADGDSDGNYNQHSVNFSDTNGTQFFVFFHAFSLGGPINPDPGGQFIAEAQIKFQHHYFGYNRTLYTTPWYSTGACTEGGG